MTKTLSTATLTALQNAASRGLMIRDFVFITGKDRTTGAAQTIGFWNGHVPITINVIDPATGLSVSRTYQAGGSLLKVPAIPAGINLEIRSIRLNFSNLTAGIISAIRQYDPRLAPVQIHRGIFDPETGALVDPAICRFDGFINRAPIKISNEGGDGSVQLECVSYARIMTKTSGTRFSDETMKLRSGDRFGRYLDVAGAWRVWWGQDEKKLGTRHRRHRERHFG